MKVGRVSCHTYDRACKDEVGLKSHMRNHKYSFREWEKDFLLERIASDYIDINKVVLLFKQLLKSERTKEKFEI